MGAWFLFVLSLFAIFNYSRSFPLHANTVLNKRIKGLLTIALFPLSLTLPVRWPPNPSTVQCTYNDDGYPQSFLKLKEFVRTWKLANCMGVCKTGFAEANFLIKHWVLRITQMESSKLLGKLGAWYTVGSDPHSIL